jgi:hypothetical protein
MISNNKDMRLRWYGYSSDFWHCFGNQGVKQFL